MDDNSNYPNVLTTVLSFVLNLLFSLKSLFLPTYTVTVYYLYHIKKRYQSWLKMASSGVNISSNLKPCFILNKHVSFIPYIFLNKLNFSFGKVLKHILLFTTHAFPFLCRSYKCHYLQSWRYNEFRLWWGHVYNSKSILICTS